MVQPDAVSELPAPIWSTTGTREQESDDAKRVTATYSGEEGECAGEDDRAALYNEFFEADDLSLRR